jgi:hypothetical protein
MFDRLVNLQTPMINGVWGSGRRFAPDGRVRGVG